MLIEAMAFWVSFIHEYGLLGVLIISMLSYTLIPIASEPFIILAATIFNPFSVLVVAMIGSTIGVLSDFYIGRKGLKKLYKTDSKWKRKAKKIFKKYGEPSVIMFGWVPFIGDPLMVTAASLDMNFIKFLIFSSIGRLFYFSISILIGVSIGKVI